MPRFENGHAFRLHAERRPPSGRTVPVVELEMAGPSHQFLAVTGMVDTGAFRTMMDFETAQRLGIGDPASCPLDVGVAETATGEELEYYVHLVRARMAPAMGEPIEFAFLAAFARHVRENLFGRDWLEHVCLAFDCEAVHFLRD